MVWALIVPLVLIVAGYSWYVALISRRNRAREALSSVDVQLRKRHDLLPNVLKLADRYMRFERELLTKVTALRNQAQQPYDTGKAAEVERHLKAEGELQTGLRQLFALAENYPDLKASTAIVEAQQTFSEVEGHIAAARRFYNAAVNQLNTAAEIFPGPLIAGLAGVETMPFFEIEDDARQPVDVDNYIGRAAS